MSSPQITWDAEPQQIKWDDERPGIPKPPNPILGAKQPSALNRGLTAFGAAAGDLFQAGSSMRGGGVPGESFTPAANSRAEQLAKSGDWRGAVKEATREKLAAEPSIGESAKAAITGPVSMITEPVSRALSGDVAGGIGEAAANYPALIANPEAREAGPAGVRAAGRTMEAHPYVTGHLVGTAAGEMVGHPYLGFIGGRFLEKPVKAIGQRLSQFRKPAEIPPPFSDVGDFSKDVFNVPDRPLEGEYVPNGPPAVGKQPPVAQAQEIQRPQLPGVGQSSVPRDMPYRVGPGGVAPEDVNAPNPRVLAGNQGIRTTPIAQLPASVAGGVDRSAMMQREAPVPVTARIGLPTSTGRAEALEDQGIGQAMGEDLESHGIQARREVNQERRSRNDISVPKWQRQAEFKAQQVMEDARKQAEDRALNRELGRGNPKIAKPTKEGPPAVKVTGEEEDLTPILTKSLEQAKKKKGGK